MTVATHQPGEITGELECSGALVALIGLALLAWHVLPAAEPILIAGEML